MAEGNPGQEPQVELPRDRCPNCGGPLKFPERGREGLCAACGIFVEIVLSTSEPLPAEPEEIPDVRSRRETAKFYLASEDLLMDEHEVESPEESGKVAAPMAATPEAVSPTIEAERPPADADPSPETPEHREPEDVPPTTESVKEAPPSMGEQSVQTVALEPDRPALPAPSEAVLALPPSPDPISEPPPPPPPPPSPPPPPEIATSESSDATMAEHDIAITEAEALVEPESEVSEGSEVVEEPSAEVEVSLEEVSAEDTLAVPPTAAPVARPASAASSSSRRRTSRPPRRDRALHYVGSTLVAFGGSGLILGSILHDLFRVPQFGSAYDAFGPVNWSALLFGFIFFAAGLAAIGVSLRGGVVRMKRAVGA